MNSQKEYWKKIYQSLEGSEDDYILAINPDVKNHLNQFYQKQKIRSLNKLLKKCYNVEKNRVLDFGCGPGFFSNILYNKGANVVGIDISENLIKRNKSYYPFIEFEYLNSNHLSFNNETFDLVLSMMVLQHIEYQSQIKLIKEFSRTLKKGGYVIIVESIYEKDKNENIYSRSKMDWNQIFSDNGFALVSMHGMEFMLLRRVYLFCRSFISKMRYNKKENKNDFYNLESKQIKTSSKKDDHSSVKFIFKQTIEFLITLLSYVVEPLSRLFLPSKLALRGAFLFKKL